MRQFKCSLRSIVIAALLIIATLPLSRAQAETAAERAGKCATLTTVNEHRVLRLRGDDMAERGLLGAVRSLDRDLSSRFSHVRVRNQSSIVNCC